MTHEALVVGADSLVGKTLMTSLRTQGFYVLGTTRRPASASETRFLLDLSSDSRLPSLPSSVSVAFLCAGMTSLANCRDNPAVSRHINVDNTLRLAEQLIKNKILVIFLSSNQVFDGSVRLPMENSPVSPVSVYGEQKADVEKALLKYGSSTLIVRFTKIINPDAGLFVDWATKLKNGQSIQPFSDYSMSPVSLQFAADVLVRAASKRLSGILHVSADRDISYEEAARTMAKQLGADQKLVQAVSVKSKGGAVESVPQFTALGTTRLQGEIGLSAPKAEDALKELVHYVENC